MLHFLLEDPGTLVVTHELQERACLIHSLNENVLVVTKKHI